MERTMGQQKLRMITTSLKTRQPPVIFQERFGN